MKAPELRDRIAGLLEVLKDAGTNVDTEFDKKLGRHELLVVIADNEYLVTIEENG